MEAKRREIVLGATVCQKIKDVYFSDKKWPECHGQISVKYSALKRIAEKFYADKDSMEIVQELVKYSDTDIRDAFDNE
jgi:hypothetical protein